MTDRPGHDPGHGLAQSAPGLSWGRYLGLLVDERGSLSAIAQHLSAQRGFDDDLETVERGLRRLRQREHKDGGTWGRRVIRAFGLPRQVTERVRWMGQYHSRFTSLPTPVCLDLLRPWDRPPVSESPARIWVQLGFASVALRGRDDPAAERHLIQARLAAGSSGDTGAPTAARIELALTDSFRIARSDPAGSLAMLKTAGDILDGEGSDIDPVSLACLRARLVDQRAYRLNKPRSGERPDHRAAAAMYQALPSTGPHFALCRRHNGLGWSLLSLGEPDAALQHARDSLRHAGDSGNLRLRAMALKLMATALGPDDPASGQAMARAADIARELRDDLLSARMWPR